MCITNQDEIDFKNLGTILRPHLKGRRLSACAMVHRDLAKAIIPQSGCNSIIGPNEDIRFTDHSRSLVIALSSDVLRITQIE